MGVAADAREFPTQAARAAQHPEITMHFLKLIAAAVVASAVVAQAHASPSFDGYDLGSVAASRQAKLYSDLRIAGEPVEKRGFRFAMKNSARASSNPRFFGGDGPTANASARDEFNGQAREYNNCLELAVERGESHNSRHSFNGFMNQCQAGRISQ